MQTVLRREHRIFRRTGHVAEPKHAMQAGPSPYRCERVTHAQGTHLDTCMSVGSVQLTVAGLALVRCDCCTPGQSVAGRRTMNRMRSGPHCNKLLIVTHLRREVLLLAGLVDEHEERFAVVGCGCGVGRNVLRELGHNLRGGKQPGGHDIAYPELPSKPLASIHTGPQEEDEADNPRKSASLLTHAPTGASP